ncbi:MAG: AI-2E family transporter [Sphaerochaeta sp.]|jgi:predicted PurR-regulated permease PerM|uniref:AI-2E family transporter n=1 Tax=Sphaerochaeta sp. TaxID=1972642 RepID=UPI002FC9E56E
MDTKTFRSILSLLLISTVLALVVVRFTEAVQFLSSVWSLLKPLLFGVGFAYLVDLPAKQLERRFAGIFKKPLKARVLAVLLSLAFFLLIITGVLVLLVPQLGLAIRQFSANLPVLYQTSVDSVQQFMHTRPELDQGFTLVQNYINTAIDEFKKSSPHLADYAFSVLGGAVSSIANGLLALIFSLYLLLGKQRLLGQLSYLLSRFLKPNHQASLAHILIVANRTFGKFFTGQFVEALILGTLCTLGMLLFRFPYALTVGSVIGVTALIPLVGAYLGGAVGFVLIFGQSLRLALFFLLFLVILQQIEGNLIYPRVVGTSVGLPGVWVFVAVLLSAGLFGIIGVLLGVPTAATLYQLLKEERDRNAPQLT